jgi:hypothetical protein
LAFVINELLRPETFLVYSLFNDVNGALRAAGVLATDIISKIMKISARIKKRFVFYLEYSLTGNEIVALLKKQEQFYLMTKKKHKGLVYLIQEMSQMS